MTRSRKLIPLKNKPGIYRKEDTGERGGKPYVVQTRHRGKQIKRSFATVKEAEEFKRQHTGRDAPPPPSRDTFEKYARHWVEEYTGRTARGLSGETRDSYRDALERYAIPFFGRQPIGEIGPRDVKDFIAHLETLEPRRNAKGKTQNGATRLSPATIRRILAPVKAMLAEAFEEEVIKTKAASVRVVVKGESRATRRRPMTLTREQIAALRDKLAERDRLFFDFLSWTGLRIGEGVRARWGDIEQTPDGPVVVVPLSKSDAGERQVALVPALMQALIKYRASGACRYPENDRPIFPSAVGTEQDDHNVRKRFNRAREQAGVPWATPHKYRHSLGTELVANGLPLTDVAKILGHSDSSFTARVYVHAKDAPRFDQLAPVIEAAD